MQNEQQAQLIQELEVKWQPINELLVIIYPHSSEAASIFSQLLDKIYDKLKGTGLEHRVLQIQSRVQQLKESSLKQEAQIEKLLQSYGSRARDRLADQLSKDFQNLRIMLRNLQNHQFSKAFAVQLKKKLEQDLEKTRSTQAFQQCCFITRLQKILMQTKPTNQLLRQLYVKQQGNFELQMSMSTKMKVQEDQKSWLQVSQCFSKSKLTLKNIRMLRLIITRTFKGTNKWQKMKNYSQKLEQKENQLLKNLKIYETKLMDHMADLNVYFDSEKRNSSVDKMFQVFKIILEDLQILLLTPHELSYQRKQMRQNFFGTKYWSALQPLYQQLLKHEQFQLLVGQHNHQNKLHTTVPSCSQQNRGSEVKISRRKLIQDSTWVKSVLPILELGKMKLPKLTKWKNKLIELYSDSQEWQQVLPYYQQLLQNIEWYKQKESDQTLSSQGKMRQAFEEHSVSPVLKYNKEHQKSSAKSFGVFQKLGQLFSFFKSQQPPRVTLKEEREEQEQLSKSHRFQIEQERNLTRPKYE